jgi:hypothetical protein
MQSFVVRPVMTGLLALIIAGLWGTPLGIGGAGAFVDQQSCRSAAPAGTPPAAITSLPRRGIHC